MGNIDAKGSSISESKRGKCLNHFGFILILIDILSIIMAIFNFFFYSFGSNLVLCLLILTLQTPNIVYILWREKKNVSKTRRSFTC